MKQLGSIIGYAIAGIFVMCVWGVFANKYGIGGGWFAGFCIISINWFINHYIGIIDNQGATVDMALGIGIAGTMRDVFVIGGQAGVESLPTLVVVCIGGALGGLTAAALTKYLNEKKVAEASKDVAA